MHILLTNDDGVRAPGLWRAAEALKSVGQVTVVAPDREQSGTGTSISLLSPIRVAEVEAPVEGVRAFSVEGTPADCVIVALERLVQDGVALVVSGINPGANLGEDVLVSGTVGAALQGFVRGIATLAVSVTSLRDVHYEPAAQLTRLLARQVAEGALPRPILLNVNLPNVPLGELQGVQVTRLGNRSYADEVTEGDDGRRVWYWIRRSKPDWQLVEGTDIWAVRHQQASITPLYSDLTAHALLPDLSTLAASLTAAMHTLNEHHATQPG
ncbi:MAG: 5'/3'-nucleotidase SurE [Chloroflexi bacterium]|nr:5'/3'-nucleotidase SurE [Chloroflexota bacterium]